MTIGDPSMRAEIRCLSDREIDVVAGGPGYKDGTSNTMMFLPHAEQDNAVGHLAASSVGQSNKEPTVAPPKIV
jgi:hypothetical protein